MRNIILFILFVLLLSPQSICSELIDNYSGMQDAWGEQKSITNQEFEKAIETLTAKQKKKDEKQRKKKIKKISGGGTSLHKTLEPMSDILEQETVKERNIAEIRLLNIPVDFFLNGKKLERGFYNIEGIKDSNGDIYLAFYQSHSFLGKIKAYKTNNDFGSADIDFVLMSPYNDEFIKIMFGSLDFNAYTYVRYINENAEKAEG